MSGVQRFLANHKNYIPNATVLSAPVQVIEDAVLEKPVARLGTAVAVISGPYEGMKPSTFELEILDTDASDEPLVTAPIFSGVGSGDIKDIAVTALDERTIEVELGDLGTEDASAYADLLSARVSLRTPGEEGNNFSLYVYRGDISFEPQAISLLTAIPAGTKSITGPEFDWDTKTVGANDVVPLDAHRVSFGEDENNIYVQYRKFINGEFAYFFDPPIKEYVPVGTVVNFVTGSYEVSLWEEVAGEEEPRESYPDVVTLYDLLSAIKETSTYLVVEGAVAFDRKEGGQALSELAIRTDAHYIKNTGFTEVAINEDSPTELIEATCIAAEPKDDEAAAPGSEVWEVRGSVSGLITARVQTGEVIEGEYFEAVIAAKEQTGTDRKGGFTLQGISLVERTGDEVDPVICPGSLTLGIAASEQTLTLTYTARENDPSNSNCAVTSPLSSQECLGIVTSEGEGDTMYQTDTIERLKDLYEWFQTTVEAYSSVAADFDGNVLGGEHPFLYRPISDTNSTPSVFKPLMEVIAEFERTIALIDPLTDAVLRADGNTVWDAAFTALQAVVTDAQGVLGGDPTDAILNIPTGQFSAKMQHALISAGLSPLGKSNANGGSGDACWQDFGSPYYWKVTGDVGGNYAPAFTNRVYYAAKKRTDGKYYSTKEFGFIISATGALKVGDTITLVIAGVPKRAGYALGDKVQLGILGARNIGFAGGVDGDNVQKWFVTDSVYGPRTPYLLDLSTPVAYDDGEVTFLITQGNIPFEKNDKFSFGIEGGHYRWRQVVDGVAGAWSASLPISATPESLADGLALEWELGTAPSFYLGDLYRFLSQQPYSISNLIKPDPDRWQWGDDPAVAIFDLGAAKDDIEALALAFHDLPEDALVNVSGSLDNVTYTWDEYIPWGKDVMAILLEEVQEARYIKVTITGAESSGAGWLYVGPALSFRNSAKVSLNRSYSMQTAPGDSGYSVYKGKGIGSRITWPAGYLHEEDYEPMMEMVDYLKVNGNEALLMFPQFTRPSEVVLGYIRANEIEVNDVFDFQPNEGVDRRFSVDIPLQGVIFP